MGGRGSNVNSVFYAEAYLAVYRAVLYDPAGDPKLIGDPYSTVFVSRLSRMTGEETLRKDAHHSYIDDSEIVVDYSPQQLMPGCLPRRLGGGLGGKKLSSQLRSGRGEKPF